jgi:sugar phosphate permease
MADWMPTTERGSAQGFIWMCSRAGGVLAPMLMVWLFHRLGDWRSPLVLGAGLGVMWCLAVWPWLRNRPEEMPRVNAAELALIASGRADWKPAASGRTPWKVMLRSSNVWALCWMYGFLGFSGNFFLFLFANYLQDYRHLDKETVKWLNVVPFACGVVACISGGYLSDLIARRSGDRRVGRRLVGFCGMSMAGAMILVTPWFDGLGWLAVLYGMTFFGNDLAMGPAWAAAGDIGERHAGTIAGAMNMFSSLMAALAAVVAGQFFHASALAEKAGDLDRHGLYMALPFAIFATSYFLGALCWLRVDVTETIPQGAE